MKKESSEEPKRKERPGAPRDLPADWDPSRDLLVGVGAGSARLLGAVPESGQGIAFVPPGTREAGIPSHVPVVHNAGELLAAVLGSPHPSPRRVRIVPSQDSWADAARCRAVAKQIQEVFLSKRLQQHTVARSGPTWLEQALGNLQHVAAHPSVDALEGAFAERPAILVSPGPSLAKNIRCLRDLRGRALVVSGTHALHHLAAEGVHPDLVLAADAGDLMRHWKGVDPAGVGALAIGVSCRSELFELGAPHIFCFSGHAGTEGWIFDDLGEDAQLSTGGSVACSALSLALRMGCDPIVLVGQDLSFPEGRFYAEGSLDGDARVERNADGTFFLRKPPGAEGPGSELSDGALRFTRDQVLVEVPAYGGGRVATSETLRAFLVWFEAVATTLERGRLWNCTQGGARIHGAVELPLAEALTTMTEGGVQAASTFASRARRVDRVQRRERLKRRIRELIAGLEPCRAAAIDCRDLARRAAGDARALGRLADLEATLKQALAPMSLLSVYAQREILEAREKALRARSVAENLAAARGLFEVVVRASDRLLAPLEAARRGLERG